MEQLLKLLQAVKSDFEDYKSASGKLDFSISEIKELWSDSAMSRLCDAYLKDYDIMQKELWKIFDITIENYMVVVQKTKEENSRLKSIAQNQYQLNNSMQKFSSIIEALLSTLEWLEKSHGEALDEYSQSEAPILNAKDLNGRVLLMLEEKDVSIREPSAEFLGEWHTGEGVGLDCYW